MAKETDSDYDCCPPKKWRGGDGMNGAIYFFAFVGAAVYFIQQADGFWMGVLGFLKAIVWPALLIYKVFTMLAL